MPDTNQRGLCPRCLGPCGAHIDTSQLRCVSCETEFFEAWPPSGVSGADDLSWYRRCWEAARERFMRERQGCSVHEMPTSDGVPESAKIFAALLAPDTLRDE